MAAGSCHGADIAIESAGTQQTLAQAMRLAGAGGTVLVFDDWFCFCGDPERGERRAFRELRQRHPRLRFEDFLQGSEAKAFICLGEGEEEEAAEKAAGATIDRFTMLRV